MAIFTTAALITAAVSAFASIAMSFVAKALQKKPKADTDSLDIEQSVQRRLRNGQPLEILVGKRIAAGVGIFDDAYGNKNEYGVSVTVLSAKPCTAFHTLFVDGEPVELSGNPANGEVNVTSHFLGRNDVARIKVRLFMGQNNGALGDYLFNKFPTKFGPLDDGGDYCVLVTTCRNTNDDFDEESGENFIPFQGYPEFKVELSGAKICDPRGGGVYGDEATYAYSDNAALIDAQFDYGWYDGTGAGRALIVGNGYPEGLMDIGRIISNANYCDAEGFRCSGIIRSGTSDQAEIWKCYNADRVEHPASIYSVPEGNRYVSENIDISLYPGAHISEYDEDGFSTEVYNEVQTVYAEPLEFYGEKDLPIYSNADWVAQDNHIPRQMSLPLLFVTDKLQAGKLEKQEICISRNPATCTISDLPFGYIRIGVGDIITLTGSAIDAVNNRDWVVKGKGQSPQGDVSLMLRAYAGADAFGFDEATETPQPNIQIPLPRAWPWWGNTPYINPGSVVDINNNVAGIINGTQELAEVNIAGRGGLTNELNWVNDNLDFLDFDVSGILDGTREVADVNIAGRGALISELDGVSGNIGNLGIDMTGILNGTREIADVRIAGRGGLISELNGVSGNIGNLDFDLSGIINGTREVADVRIAGRGALISELDGVSGNIGNLGIDMTGILNGTREIADVRIAGRGGLISELNGVSGNIGNLDFDLSGIINGTREVADVRIAGRGALISELDGVSGNISNLDIDLTGIINGTREIADVNIAGRGILSNELDGVSTNLGALGGDVSGIIAGTRVLSDVNIAGRGILTSELDSVSTNLVSLGGDVSGIIGGTRTLSNVTLAGRGILTNELDGVSTNLGALGADLDGIKAGTLAVADVNITGRGVLSTELDNVSTNLGAIGSDLDGIKGGTLELTNVNITGRDALTTELDTISGNVSTLTTEVTSLDSDMTGIKDGTLTVTDVTIEGIGSLINKDAAQDANINTAASSGTTLSVTVTPSAAFAAGTSTSQSITTNSIALTISNESGAETISYVLISGSSGINVDSPTSATTTFSGAPGPNGKSAIYEAIVDDNGVIATVQIPVTLDYFDPNNSY